MLRTPGAGAMRILRGVMCAAVGVLLGSLAHILGDGHAPDPLTLTIGFVVFAFVGVALAEHQRGFAFIAAVLGAGQLFLHLAFSIAAAASFTVYGSGSVRHLAGHGHTPVSGPGNGMGPGGPAGDPATGSAAAGGALPAGVPGADLAGTPHAALTGAETASGLTSWSPAMTLGHAAATLAAALILAHGERAIWRLARLVVPVLLFGWWTRPVPRPVIRAPRPEAAPLTPLFGALLARRVPRRGPPAYAV
jgi:hypothetical protein